MSLFASYSGKVLFTGLGMTDTFYNDLRILVLGLLVFSENMVVLV